MTTTQDTLPGLVELATPGVVIDTGAHVTRGVAELMKASGVAGVLRYIDTVENVPEPGTVRGVLMIREEAVGILEAGLALMPVQCSVRDLTAQTGARAGAAAAANARELGFAPGVTVWMDIEATGGDSAANIIAFVNAWVDEVEPEFEAGIYVGTKKLTAEQLYRSLTVTRYWASAMTIPEVAMRGYCQVQTRAHERFGIKVDHNTLLRDEFGDLPRWQVACT